MCRHDTGHCQSGCTEGFTGNLCVQGTLPFFFFFIHNDGNCVVCQYYHYEADQKIIMCPALNCSHEQYNCLVLYIV